MNPAPALRRADIFAQWLPMAGTWLMMAVESPLLAALIARAAEPKYNLAAFGVAYAVALLAESPVIMILSASTALVEGPLTLQRLRAFGRNLNLGVTLALALLVLTPAWSLAARALGLDPVVAHLTRGALVILLPWPGAIGYRRFYQGLLIRGGRTRLVAYGTTVRVASMAGAAFGLYFGTSIPGAWIGAAALSIGVTTEAVAARLMAIGVVKELLATSALESGEGTSQRGIFQFYLPLALTSMIGLAAQPMITLFASHARFGLESLAVLPVVHSISFLFRAIGLSYQEVALALLARGRSSLGPVVRFGVVLAIGSSLAQGLVAFTPLSHWWLIDVAGLQAELAAFARLPLCILTIAPALSVMQSLQRAVLMHARMTRPLTGGIVVEVAGILLGLLLTVVGFEVVGATAAAVSFIGGRAAGNLYLLPACLRGTRGRSGVAREAGINFPGA